MGIATPTEKAILVCNARFIYNAIFHIDVAQDKGARLISMGIKMVAMESVIAESSINSPKADVFNGYHLQIKPRKKMLCLGAETSMISHTLLFLHKYKQISLFIAFTGTLEFIKSIWLKDIQPINEGTHVKHPLLSNHVTFLLFDGTYWTADSIILPWVPSAFNSVQS